MQIHPGALQAAHVANCAADQGKFWPMNERLFAGQGNREWGDGSAADLQVFLGYAQDLELDTDALAACVRENRHAAQIEADLREAAGHGLNSTPSFIVNGQLLLGARPFASWKQLFDSILAKP